MQEIRLSFIGAIVENFVAVYVTKFSLCYNRDQHKPYTKWQFARRGSLPITIIAVGKLRDKGLSLLSQEYQKRLSRFCRLQIIEVADEQDPGDNSEKLAQKAITLEGERVLTKIKPQDVVVALCIDGQQVDSLALSRMVGDWHEASTSLVFVIGGSLGLSKQVQERADAKLSMSELTFPHQLARVMLLEQLFRAYKIHFGERYHK